VDAPKPGPGDRGDVHEVTLGPHPVSYRARMKRSSPRKLNVRTETIRALASVELTNVAGGNAALLAESSKELCTTRTGGTPQGG
jgi:hypothetical protein